MPPLSDSSVFVRFVEFRGFGQILHRCLDSGRSGAFGGDAPFVRAIGACEASGGDDVGVVHAFIIGDIAVFVKDYRRFFLCHASHDTYAATFGQKRHRRHCPFVRGCGGVAKRPNTPLCPGWGS